MDTNLYNRILICDSKDTYISFITMWWYRYDVSQFKFNYEQI